MKNISHEKHRLAARYLGGIRNPFKRTYGIKYWNWLTSGADYPEYEGISYMAAQSVRMRLADIKGGITQSTPELL